MDFLGTIIRGLGATVVSTASSLITNATTNVDCITVPIPANSLEVGSIYRITAWVAHVHAGGATSPDVIAELVVNGVTAPVHRAFTLDTATTNGTFGVKLEATVVCRSVGASGSINAVLESFLRRSDAFSAAGQWGVKVGADLAGLNTTAVITLLLRARMSAAVASNTLQCLHAYAERVE